MLIGGGAVLAALVVAVLLIPQLRGAPTSGEPPPHPVANPTVFVDEPTYPDYPTQDPNVEGPLTTALGESVRITCNDVECMDVKVVKVGFAARYKDPSGYYDDKPGRGLVFMAVDVTYKAVGPNADYNPLDWGVYVNDVAVGDYTYVTNGPKPELHSGDLPKGKTATGWIVYEVPKSGRITITYQPGGADGAIFEVVLRTS